LYYIDVSDELLSFLFLVMHILCMPWNYYSWVSGFFWDKGDLAFFRENRSRQPCWLLVYNIWLSFVQSYFKSFDWAHVL